MSTLHTFRDVIEALGGSVEVSNQTGLHYNVVANMYARDSVNARYFISFAEMARQSGRPEIDCVLLSRIAADARKNGGKS
jgi:hypothetical protein